MVDGVELVALDQPRPGGGTRSRRRPPAQGCASMPAMKSLRSGTWAKTLLATSRSARRPSAASRLATSRPKNSTTVSIPLLARGLGDVGRGLDAERRDAQLDDVLQQVAVVAGELDHEAVGVEAEAVDGGRHRVAGVRDPGVRVRREVGVLGEDLLGGDELLELDEQAALADAGVERIERLHRAEAVGGHVGLAQGRHAEVDERVAQVGAAESALRPGGRHRGASGAVSNLDGHRVIRPAGRSARRGRAECPARGRARDRESGWRPRDGRRRRAC